VINIVIVPLDGSSTAEVALPYAAESCGSTGHELILLFVKETNDYRSENIIQAYLDNMVMKIKEDAKQYFQVSGFQTLKSEPKY